MATEIQYIKGDATSPAAEGNKIIVHICNDIGGWGKGFVMALSKKWAEPEKMYRQWYQSKDNFKLGEVQFVQVDDDTWIANVIGQRDIRRDKNGVPPIRYDAVASGLEKVGNFAKELGASVHMPRIGCGLAGGSWDKIEPLIGAHISNKQVDITVYDFDSSTS